MALHRLVLCAAFALLTAGVAPIQLALGGAEAHAQGTAPSQSAADVPGEHIGNASRDPNSWMSHGRGYDESRHSTLTQINRDTIGRLGLSWSYNLDTNRGQEATPLMVDGVLYVSTAWSKVVALDAVTGRLLWQYDPQVPGAAGAKACCDVVNRGVAYWRGKIFVASLDGRLIAIDARTGKPLWSTVTVDQGLGYTITGAPRVVRGRVIIGNGGGEFGVRGYVSAYDADTGAMAWRFYTVPGQPGIPDHAASDATLNKVTATWSGEWWRQGGGGGNVWDSMSYDPKLDLLYIGVGNGSYWNRLLRSPGGGDNLFVASIVALRPETGRYVWHYQETPGEQFDYDATNDMILADLTVQGKTRRVLMQAAKNGFFYVLDRATGQLISARPFVNVNWANGIDQVTGRPNVNPDADYSKSGKPWVGMPGALGAHDWMPMAFSPVTGLAYIPTQELAFPFVADPTFAPKPQGVNLGVDLAALDLPDDGKVKASVRESIKGFLVAWDPVAQKEVWRVPHDGAWNGGVLSTAGNLVFQGDGNGMFNAFDAGTGGKLWSYDVQTGVVAPPMTWAKNGKQYLTLVAGWGGAFPLLGGELSWGPRGAIRNRSRILTFALDETATLPAVQQAPAEALQPPVQFATAQTIASGRKAYDRTCLACHGSGAVSGGILPDLRHSTAIADKTYWDSVLVDGVLAGAGMVSFKENFSPDELEAIRAYIISRARIDAASNVGVSQAF